MCAINEGRTDAAYRLIDAAHVAMIEERTTRSQVASALQALSGTKSPVPQGQPLTVGESSEEVGYPAAGHTPRASRSSGRRICPKP
ncbi:hypothetical protein NRB20_51910 [Nocardia sp. RB20]|uniref:ANTAR domain-containing protein n=2 Tax=Nocardia macrotermitis TaxID=2585198 RepID=A0A7K0D8N5_9NOCA|nr:hypothetical protein [Nocardia macrotermitis]